MEHKPHIPQPKLEAPRWHQDALLDIEEEKERLSHTYEYQILDDVETRTEYVKYTERLIADIIADNVDTMIFLDKSARPVAWMVKAMWPLLGIGQDGQPVRPPQIRFANIDREQWGPLVGRSENKDIGIDMNRVHPDTIDSLRGMFAFETLGPDEDARQTPTQFDGKNIRIIDEVKSSGDTLVMASNLFSRAFPTAEVKTSYWMTPKIKVLKGGARVNADLPLWYKEDDPRGRLVADRNTNRSLASDSRRQRRGALFLSTRFIQPDDDGLQLRREMYELADEVADGIIPVTPGAERSEVALEVIMRGINNLSIKEFVALKRISETESLPFQRIVVDYKRKRALQAHPSFRQ